MRAIGPDAHWGARASSPPIGQATSVACCAPRLKTGKSKVKHGGIGAAGCVYSVTTTRTPGTGAVLVTIGTFRRCGISQQSSLLTHGPKSRYGARGGATWTDGCGRPDLDGRTPGPTRRGRAYQACEPPQCGQPTEVETDAWKMKPHSHEYTARSSIAGSRRRRALGTRAGAVEPLRGRSSADDAAIRSGRERSAAGRSGCCPSAPTGSRVGRLFRWRPSIVAPDLLLASTRIPVTVATSNGLSIRPIFLVR